MKLKKTFTTLFTDTENFHLVKDVGQLAYFMYKTEGYDATLVSYRNNNEYPFLDSEVKGLNMTFIPNEGRFLYFEFGILSYLWSNSTSIDILNLFHFKKDHLLYLLIYKIRNPLGKAYIKLDMDILFFKDYNQFLYSKYSLKNFLLKRLTSWIFRLTDVFSVETDEARDYLLKVYPELKQKLITIPNGVDNVILDNEIPAKAWVEKEDIIITVGRIGTFQKNTELLLEALTNVKLGHWKVYIIGPVEHSFQMHIDEFFSLNPNLREKVNFTGNIMDRKELFEWYNRAKVFCLTSRFEGFPIAFPEALYFGNYIISTPVSSSGQITHDGQFGKVVKAEAREFAEAIQQTIKPGFLNADQFERTRLFARANFTWPGIIKKLGNQLKQDA